MVWAKYYTIKWLPEAWPLCTPVSNQISERVLGEVEKDSIIALPSKGDILGFCFEKLCVRTQDNLMRGFITMIQRWVAGKIRV